MSLPIILTPYAELDLTEARDWYEQQRPQLGDELIQAVDTSLAQIHRHTQIGTELMPGIRKLLVRRFPYVIIYRLEVDQIAILAIYHTKRDPQAWQMRI